MIFHDTVKVVKYKGRYYIWYKTNESGRAQLIDENGKKFSGTPVPTQFETFGKNIYCKEFNGHWYFNTKIGCFSKATGNKIINPDIVNLFK